MQLFLYPFRLEIVLIAACTSLSRCSLTTTRSDMATEYYHSNDTVVYDADNGLGDDSVTTRSTDIKIMLLTISSFGIPANIMVAIIIISTPAMRRKPFNIFILHQSFVDFIASAVTFFLQLFDDIDTISSRVGADIFCRVWVATSLMWITILASTYNLTCMTIERHRAVTRPLLYDELKVRRRLPFVCIMVWVCAFAVFSPDIIFSRIVDGQCRANIDIPPNLYKFFFFFWTFTTTLIPTTIMVSCYSHMAYFLMKSAKQFGPENTNVGSQSSSQIEPDKRQQYMKAAQKNVLQTGAILVIVYAICYSYLIIIDSFIISKVLNFSSMEWNVALALVLGNSCINPLIYSFRYHQFQLALKSLVCGLL